MVGDKDGPVNPHHSSSFCAPWPADCGWDGFDDNSKPNYFTLYGALVGGPDAKDDQHVDDRTDYYENEVTNDYNAGFQGRVVILQFILKNGIFAKV